MDLSNKVVWITGASSGIGQALAIECARRGAILMLTARRMEQLDVVVLNAGIGQRGSVEETDPDVERQVMEVNYFGCTEVAHTVLPHFLDRNDGHFVIVSSIMGKLSTPRRATYAASKHALHGFFEGLRAELHHTRIAVTLLCTGYIKTQISVHSVEGDGKAHGAMDDQHRNAMPADVYASKAVRAIERKKPVVYIGGLERFAPQLERLSPALVRWLLPKVITRN